MTTKFSPGPLCCLPQPGAYPQIGHLMICERDMLRVVAVMESSPPGAERENGYAKLFVAAPELLAALSRLVAKHLDQVFICGADDEASAAFALNEAENAIAKATGEHR